MKNFFDCRFGNKASGFDSPTQLPRGEEQRQQWHSANKTWWESSPMRYDWRNELPAAPGSKEYFGEIDRRFFRPQRNSCRRKAFRSTALFLSRNGRTKMCLKSAWGRAAMHNSSRRAASRSGG